MMQFDKAIRAGLARQSAAPQTVHPEADLLTALVEQALSQPERQQVLQHLSRCSDCREVVALSLPQIEAAPAVAAQPAKSLWTSWLVVRWAAAAAAVVVVAGTVTLYRSVNPSHQAASIVDGPAYIASQQAKPTAPAQAQVAKSEPQAEAATTEANTKTKASDNVPIRHQAESPTLMANAAPAEGVAPAAPSAVASAAQKKDNARTDQMLAKAQPAPVVPPPVTVAESQSPKIATLAQVTPLDKAVPVQGAMNASTGASNSAFPPGNGRALRPSDEPVLQTYTQDAGTFSLSAAEPPAKRSGIMFGGRGTDAAAKTLARRETLGVGMFSVGAAPMPNAPSLNRRWQVTSDGQLQRSHAIGEQFHPVHVADGIFFKAVAENGSEVWAGGVGGALYHSTDDGKSWMKVMPSAGDQPLIADVTAIRATGRGAAELNTSKGERWITVDGGQHWIRHE